MSEEQDLESQISDLSSDAGTTDTDSITDADTESEDELFAAGFVNAYQDEPIAMPGENELRAQEVDEDGILAATLDARLEGRIPLNDWCECNQCRTDFLLNAREYRCCWEVGPAIGKLQFDGSIEHTRCVTQHQDYIDLTKRVVLEQVGPLLRDKQGRAYRRRGQQDINEFRRAVAYRWLVRWMCGYLGWDHARPLPACVYNRVRTDFSPTGQARGYSSSQDRE
ncbi:Hypp6571 [Branchiostoma lanceolatum]|uniref:Hypp6571 protein n=1 Tax=Branchiostoma lanceolatum TaxID=7740 RepID=A0A8J9YV30_BRALA|nr:Hypp6571 [Branchiostoma lanceolatum]